MVARHLPEIVVTENIRLTIANGGNAAGGFGITPQVADEIFSYGVDHLATTSGTSARSTNICRASPTCCGPPTMRRIFRARGWP
jgi:calcineurin-like phosphoesterase